MALPSVSRYQAGQEDQHAGLGKSALVSKEETLDHMALYGTRQIDTAMVSEYMVCYGRETKWFRSCGQDNIYRGNISEEQAEIGDVVVPQGHGNILA